MSTDDDLQRFADDLAAWSDDTFKGQTSAGKLAHLAKEVKELCADPADKMEYADCFMLLIDAWRLDHGDMNELLYYASQKLEICRNRTWGEPNADGSVEHIREQL